MQLSDAVLSALIATVVSFIVSLVTYFGHTSVQKRELKRRFTEKLYDLRLDAYPTAYEISDRLRSEFVFSEDLSEELLRRVREELNDWKCSRAGFWLSPKAAKAFFKLRSALSMKPENGAKYGRSQQKHFWECKNRFRHSLMSDLELLFEEEPGPDKEI